MTATITLMNGKTIFVRDITSMAIMGRHTYEFGTFDNDRHGKLRVVEVVHIVMSDMCPCHNPIEAVIDMP